MIDFSDEKEKMLLEYIFSNEILFNKVYRILNSEYFEKPLDSAVEFVMHYFDSYNNLPSLDIIKAESGVEFEAKELNEPQFNYITDEIEAFCKNSAFREAIMVSADEIGDNEFGNAEKRIREAMSISIDTDLGLDLFASPASRLLMMEENIDAIGLGWSKYDQITNLTKRGEMMIAAGGSGSGKSVLLTNIMNNLTRLGLNGVYITLELKDSLVAKRFDSILTGVPIINLLDDLENIENIYKRIQQQYGNLTVKKMPVNSTANDIRSYLFEYELTHHYIPDVIIIDHMDLMNPNGKNSRDDAFDRDKQIAEEVREIFIDYNSYGFTASQLNRCHWIYDKVTTRTGEKFIKDVGVGEEVLSHDSYRIVEEVLPITKQRMYEVTTKSGKIITISGNHKIPTKTGIKTIYSGLGVGDLLHSDK